MHKIIQKYFLLFLLLCFALNINAQRTNKESYAEVKPNPNFTFPRDHGAHPEFRTEWWYATGHLQTASGKPLGFQVTFFRSRTNVDATNANVEINKSKFAPTQILFAHAAIADVAHGKLRHDERIARQGFGNMASAENMNVKLDRWTMKMDGNTIKTKIPARDFTLDLAMTLTKPPLLQGENGYSQKGPNAIDASYYVSLPQLKVSGNIIVNGKTEAVSGTAWFDHEWSNSYLSDEASGWDWLGANFDDGGALMAFQMRDKKGGVLWAAATRLLADGSVKKIARDAINFKTQSTWKSPRTGAIWPNATNITLGDEVFEIKPWMNDQELDSSRSTGIVYWEGAVDLLSSKQRVGRGYLELTGYAKPIKF